MFYRVTNVSADSISLDAGWELARIVTLSLATIGGFASLVGLVAVVLRPRERWVKILPWVVAVIAFVAAILVAAFM